MVNEGYGFIADSVGTYSGVVPYTAFNALNSYINENKDTINKFYKGIEKGLNYVDTHDPSEIATVIKDQFPDTSIDELTMMISNYKDADSWFKNPNITEESFNNLQNILLDNNEIKETVNYENLIYEVN